MKFYSLILICITCVLVACSDVEDEPASSVERTENTDEENEVLIKAGSEIVPNNFDTLTYSWSGRYMGRNVYLQNTFAGNGEGFCAYSIKVNGDPTIDEITSSAVEIDFTNLEFEIGDSIYIEILHKHNCSPRVLVPYLEECYESKADVTEISITEDSLFWTTQNEMYEFFFAIEQYRWGGWYRVGEVLGAGLPITSKYSFALDSCLINGENKFRIKQRSIHKPKISKIVSKDYNREPIVFNTNYSEIGYLNFSTYTHYQLLDEYENRVANGYDDKIDLTNFEKGIYFLNYDTVQNVNITLF